MKTETHCDAALATIHFVSLGCAKNLVDSEYLMGWLEHTGYILTSDPATAEVIIVNTCGFIESAASESIDTILTLAQYKTRGTCRRLLVVGCLPQRHRDELVQALPEVDFFLGTRPWAHLKAALNPNSSGRSRFEDPAGADMLPEQPRRRLSTNTIAWLKVSEGCNRHCTYCIIPHLRGPQRSRTSPAILAEARELLAAGVAELVLIGQDTTAFGRDLAEPVSLATLLDELAELAPECWIRFLYGHPLSFSPELLDVMERHANICPYLDLPIQHAADGVLKRMGRHYTRQDLRQLFNTIRTRLPQVALRTTVLVGFPGETRSEFQQLLDFMEEIKFDHLGGFTYSDAPDLPAHHLPRHVGARVAQQRLDTLMTLQMALAETQNRRYLGQVLPVLIEGHDPHENLWQGRSMFQAPEVDGVVRIAGLAEGHPTPAVGKRVNVEITGMDVYDLTGVWI